MDYIFDPDVIHECSMQGIGKPKPEMFDAIADAWEDAYPGRIDRSQPWMYSIAGGAMIQMKLYYASPREYVMIWGTPIGSRYVWTKGDLAGLTLSFFGDTGIDRALLDSGLEAEILAPLDTWHAYRGTERKEMIGQLLKRIHGPREVLIRAKHNFRNRKWGRHASKRRAPCPICRSTASRTCWPASPGGWSRTRRCSTAPPSSPPRRMQASVPSSASTATAQRSLTTTVWPTSSRPMARASSSP